MAAEERKQKFIKMANKRVGNVLIGLKRLGNLSSGAYRYDGHPQDFNTLLDHIIEKAEGMKTSEAMRPRDLKVDVEQIFNQAVEA